MAEGFAGCLPVASHHAMTVSAHYAVLSALSLVLSAITIAAVSICCEGAVDAVGWHVCGVPVKVGAGWNSLGWVCSCIGVLCADELDCGDCC